MTATTSWRRLHPLSPLLRSGKILLGLGIGLTPQVASGDGASLAVVIVAVLLPLLLAFGYLSWRRTRFTVQGAELHVTSGILLHRERRVPLARVQAIDVVRPLVGRALGLAELRIEVVGGGQSEAPLAYLRESEAAALRVELLALARGEVSPDESRDRPTSQLLVTVPTRALVVSVLLDGHTLVPVALFVVLVASAWVLPSAAMAGLGATVFALGVGAFEVVRRRLLAEWGFTVSETPDGLVLGHGLLETRTQTVPDGRVQGVRLVRPLLWRRRGWVRVEVDVAGYSGRGAALVTSTLLPVAPADLAEALVARVLGAQPPHAVVGEGAGGFAPPPRRARWLAPLSRRVLGLALDDRFVVTRTGWLRHDIAVVPLGKAQGLRLRQGPLQRRLRLASLHVDTAGRDIHAVAMHRDLAEARMMLIDLADRARVRRSDAPPVLAPRPVRQDSPASTRT